MFKHPGNSNRRALHLVPPTSHVPLNVPMPLPLQTRGLPTCHPIQLRESEALGTLSPNTFETMSGYGWLGVSIGFDIIA